VICPHRELNFGNPEPVREFLEHRVQWIELQPRDGQPPNTPLARVLSLLLQPEEDVPRTTSSLREQATTDPVAAEVLPLIPAILISRFRDRTLQEICTMGGITLDDLSRSRAYQEIFGLGESRGEARGEARGRTQELSAVTLRLLKRRCGTISAGTTARIQALPLEQLEALAEALLDFTGPADLDAWLAAHA
jgi:predicted transposase YdaD